jgi:hypothetical protein
MTDSIVPTRSTPLEVVLDAQEARVLDIPAPLRDLWNPRTCPEHLLPYLAWALSVDLWRSDWPLDRRRYIIEKSIELHRLKGTLGGIKRYLELVDAPLKRALRPPDTFFPDPAITEAERAAYLARFQQLRIYDFRSAGTATYGAFTRGAYKLAKTFCAGGASDEAARPTFFPHTTDAVGRIGKQAYVYEPRDGSETKLAYAVRETLTEDREAITVAAIPGANLSRAFFCGGKPTAKRYAYNVRPSDRLVTVRMPTTYTHGDDVVTKHAITPGLEPIYVIPEMIAEPGQKTFGQMFPADNFIRTPEDGAHPLNAAHTKAKKLFLPPSTAQLRLYSRIHLYDPTRLPDKRRRKAFAGYVRLGMPPYHADITVNARETISKFAFGRFVHGYLHATPKRKFYDSIEATRLSKSFRDEVRLTARVHRPARVGDRRPVGSSRVGDWISAA